MNQNDFIVWAFEQKLLRSVRYGLKGRENWAKTEGGIWPIVEEPQPASPEAAPEEAPVSEAGEVVEADKPLARAVREAHAVTHAKSVVLSLPLSRLLVQVMKFPVEMREELADAVSLQMDKLSPFGGEELTISHEVLAETETDLWVLCAAMPSVTFDDIGAALRLEKIHVTRTDISGLGWFRTLCAPLQLTRPGRRVVLMDLDDGWDMIIMDHGIPVLIRGMGHQPDIDSLLREITLSFMTAELEAGSCSASEVLIVTNNPPDAERDDRIHKLLDTPISYHKPPHEDGGVEGVALRTRENATMDLTPAVWRQAVEEARIAKRIYTGIGIAMTIWTLIMGILFGAPFYYKFKTDRCKAYSKAHDKAYKQVSHTRSRVQLIESYRDRTRSSLEMLRIASDSLPRGITLLSFVYKKEEGFKVTGEADDPSQVYAYKDTITNYQDTDANKPLFENVTLKGPSASRGKHKFDIDARFEGGQKDK
jgi:hypothetical protein